DAGAHAFARGGGGHIESEPGPAQLHDREENEEEHREHDHELERRGPSTIGELSHCSHGIQSCKVRSEGSGARQTGDGSTDRVDRGGQLSLKRPRINRDTNGDDERPHHYPFQRLDSTLIAHVRPNRLKHAFSSSRGVWGSAPQTPRSLALGAPAARSVVTSWPAP